MIKQNLPYFVLATALVGSLIQAIWFWVQLPDRVASHFNAAGQPNGWMSKSAFVGFSVLLQCLFAFFLIGVGRVSTVLPNSMINIPNRDYWLASERREKTLNDTNRMLAWIAAATALFLLLIFQMTFVANVDENEQLSSVIFWVSIVAYISVVVGFCVVHTLKYRTIPADARQQV